LGLKKTKSTERHLLALGASDLENLSDLVLLTQAGYKAIKAAT